MSTLINAPLLSAHFRLYWGRLAPRAEGARTVREFEFSQEERKLLPGRFKAEAATRGYLFVQEPQVPESVPFLPTATFRKEKNAHPMFQIGLGLLGVSQRRQGYDWATFKASVLEGVAMLRVAWPTDVADLPIWGAELLYRDYFQFEAEEQAADFLERKLQLNLRLPAGFLTHDALEVASARADLIFSVNTREPAGQMFFELQQFDSKSGPGYNLNTSLRSSWRERPMLECLDQLDGWLEAAHRLQRHAFQTLIDPRFAQTFERPPQ